MSIPWQTGELEILIFGSQGFSKTIFGALLQVLSTLNFASFVSRAYNITSTFRCEKCGRLGNVRLACYAKLEGAPIIANTTPVSFQKLLVSGAIMMLPSKIRWESVIQEVKIRSVTTETNWWFPCFLKFPGLSLLS